MNYGVCFDRDGTLIKHIPYLFNKEEVELLPTVKEAFALCKQYNIKLFLHTNQSGVSKNKFTLQDVIDCNNRMCDLLNIAFDDICIATENVVTDSNFRKPSPLFGKLIMKKFNISNTNLAYIGDNITDLQTAKNCNCLGLGVNTGINNFDKNCLVFNNLLDAVKYFIYNVYNRK